jgi:hypothetical protein
MPARTLLHGNPISLQSKSERPDPVQGPMAARPQTFLFAPARAIKTCLLQDGGSVGGV